MWRPNIFLLVLYFVTVDANVEQLNMEINPGFQIPGHFPKNIITDILNLVAALPYYMSPTGPGIDPKCQSDGDMYKEALLNQDLWAVQMFDADPKFPQPGLTDGNFLDFPGSFDTCLKADSGTFRGKYCLLGLWTANINDLQPQVRSFAQIPMEFKGIIKTAICIPSSCSEDDAALGMTYYLMNATKPNENGEFFVAYSLGCQSEDTETEFTSGDWAMVAVLAIFGLVIGVSTLIDMFNKFMGKFCSDKILGVVHGFSAYNNVRKLFDSKPSSENLGCINGIRFISMTWVVIGHTFQNFTTLSGIGFWTNPLYIFSLDGPATTTASAAIWNADSSVDTFFLIGAILLSYLTLKQLDKKKPACQTWSMYYIHRYLRLSGVYAMVIFLSATLLKPLLNYGPQGHLLDYTAQGCKEDWWISLLYLSNFNIRGKEEFWGPACLGHTWYLNVDMQLFIFTPLIIYPLWKFPKVGLVLSGIVTLGATIIPLAIVWADDPWTGGWSGDFVEFYIKPWNRIQPYIVGLVVGFMLYKMRDKPKLPINWMVNLICWLVSALVACACLYGIADYSPVTGKPVEHYQYVLYMGFNRLAWSLAISWVIVACIKDMGGPINEFLSWGGFVPGARVSYCMYLAHYTIVSWYNSVQKTNTTYSTEVFIYYCLAHILMTAGVALVLVICFEMPILHVEKLLFGMLGLAAMPQARKDDISDTMVDTEKKALK